MDLKHTDKVKPEAERPARRDGTCFYCCEPVGGRHKNDCVLIEKSVVMRLIADVIVPIPRHWDRSHTEFHFNDSSYCLDTMFRHVGRWCESDHENGPGCMCGVSEVNFLRDADKKDHAVIPFIETEKETSSEDLVRQLHADIKRRALTSNDVREVSRLDGFEEAMKAMGLVPR